MWHFIISQLRLLLTGTVTRAFLAHNDLDSFLAYNDLDRDVVESSSLWVCQVFFLMVGLGLWVLGERSQSVVPFSWQCIGGACCNVTYHWWCWPGSPGQGSWFGRFLLHCKVTACPSSPYCKGSHSTAHTYGVPGGIPPSLPQGRVAI